MAREGRGRAQKIASPRGPTSPVSFPQEPDHRLPRALLAGCARPRPERRARPSWSRSQRDPSSTSRSTWPRPWWRRCTPPPPPPPAEPEPRDLEVCARGPPVRLWSAWRSDTTGPMARADEALQRQARRRGAALRGRARRVPALAQLHCSAASRRRPSSKMWASSHAGEQLTHVTTYEICSISKSGDLAAPSASAATCRCRRASTTSASTSPRRRITLAILVTYSQHVTIASWATRIRATRS